LTFSLILFVSLQMQQMTGSLTRSFGIRSRSPSPTFFLKKKTVIATNAEIGTTLPVLVLELLEPPVDQMPDKLPDGLYRPTFLFWKRYPNLLPPNQTHAQASIALDQNPDAFYIRVKVVNNRFDSFVNIKPVSIEKTRFENIVGQFSRVENPAERGAKVAGLPTNVSEYNRYDAVVKRVKSVKSAVTKSAVTQSAATQSAATPNIHPRKRSASLAGLASVASSASRASTTNKKKKGNRNKPKKNKKKSNTTSDWQCDPSLLAIDPFEIETYSRYTHYMASSGSTFWETARLEVLWQQELGRSSTYKTYNSPREFASTVMYRLAKQLAHLYGILVAEGHHYGQDDGGRMEQRIEELERFTRRWNQ